MSSVEYDRFISLQELDLCHYVEPFLADPETTLSEDVLRRMLAELSEYDEHHLVYALEFGTRQLQIGSTRQIVGSDTGNPPTLQEVAYSAFGERLASQGSIDSRYGYVGAYGYQSAGCYDIGGVSGTGWCDPLAELGWLHVGARYYDPSVGRFMQRDPIGIRGGLNVYAYTMNNPTFLVDPRGFQAAPPAPPDPETEPGRAELWKKMGWGDLGSNVPPGAGRQPTEAPIIPLGNICAGIVDGYVVPIPYLNPVGRTLDALDGDDFRKTTTDDPRYQTANAWATIASGYKLIAKIGIWGVGQIPKMILHPPKW